MNVFGGGGILCFSRRYDTSSAASADLDIGERIAGKQDGPGPIFVWAMQDPPNSQKCKKKYFVAPIWKTGSYFVSLLYICLLCDEVLLPWNFRSPGFDVRAPRTPKYEKKNEKK